MRSKLHDLRLWLYCFHWSWYYNVWQETWLYNQWYKWRVNVWRNRSFIKDGEWKYYYCSLWCFFTDQALCSKHSKKV